ncbi:MAG: hypothetical protein AB1529_03090 [Candidatus Micrarchaeota archaeon]
MVSNIPGMGLNEAFSPRRPRGNSELLGFLDRAGLTLEHLHFPPAAMFFPDPAAYQPAAYPALDESVRERGSMVLVSLK